MVNDKLLEIIKELKNRGHSNNEIRNILIDYKVDIDEINENLNYYNSNNYISSQIFKTENTSEDNVDKKEINYDTSKETENIKKSLETTKKFSSKTIILIVVLSLVIVGLIFAYFALSNNKEIGLEDEINGQDFNVSQEDPGPFDDFQEIDPETFSDFNEEYIANNLDLFTSFLHPLKETFSYDFMATNPDDLEDDGLVIINTEIYFLEENIYDINYSFLVDIDDDEEKFYQNYGGYAFLSFFLEPIIVIAHDSSFEISEDDFLVGDDVYLNIPDNQKYRFYLLNILFNSILISEDKLNDFIEISSVILNSENQFRNFNVVYFIDYNQEEVIIFKLNINSEDELIERTMYDADTREAQIEIISYQEFYDNIN